MPCVILEHWLMMRYFSNQVLSFYPKARSELYTFLEVPPNVDEVKIQISVFWAPYLPTVPTVYHGPKSDEFGQSYGLLK